MRALTFIFAAIMISCQLGVTYTTFVILFDGDYLWFRNIGEFSQYDINVLKLFLGSTPPLELMAAAAGSAYYFDEPMSVYRFSIRGSWTSSQMSGDVIRKQREFADRMEKTYQDFDRETGGRFHAEAERAARRLRFLTEVNLRSFREIYKKENRCFLKELNRRDRFFLRFEAVFPGLYRALQKRFGAGSRQKKDGERQNGRKS